MGDSGNKKCSHSSGWAPRSILDELECHRVSGDWQCETLIPREVKTGLDSARTSTCTRTSTCKSKHSPLKGAAL
jgi:hypothetical protein